MRVMFVSHSAELTGAPISCYKLMKGLGPRVRRVLVTPTRGPVSRMASEDLIKCYCVGEKRPLGLGYITGFLDVIEREEIELIHLNTLTPYSKYAAIAGFLKGIPCVWFVREDPLISRSRRLAWWMRALASRIVFVDQDTRDKLLGGLAADRTSVIPNGVDTAVFSPGGGDFLLDNYGVPKGVPVIGYLGRITERKGILYLVLAMREILRQRPDAVLLMFGEHGGQDTDYFNSLDPHVVGLRDRIRFLSPIPDPAYALRELSLLVLPSLDERCSRTLIEALSTGIPVVATDVGGNPGIVEHGVSGLLVPPRDPKAIARAVLELLGDPDSRRRMGRAGREKAIRQYDMGQNVERIRKIYEEVIALP